MQYSEKWLRDNIYKVKTCKITPSDEDMSRIECELKILQMEEEIKKILGGLDEDNQL